METQYSLFLNGLKLIRRVPYIFRGDVASFTFYSYRSTQERLFFSRNRFVSDSSSRRWLVCGATWNRTKEACFACFGVNSIRLGGGILPEKLIFWITITIGTLIGARDCLVGHQGWKNGEKSSTCWKPPPSGQWRPPNTCIVFHPTSRSTSGFLFKALKERLWHHFMWLLGLDNPQQWRRGCTLPLCLNRLWVGAIPNAMAECLEPWYRRIKHPLLFVPLWNKRPIHLSCHI